MGLVAAIRRWRSIRARTDEFGSLGRDQQEALARDVGLPVDTLGALMARGPESAAELPRLMQALDLAPERTEEIHPAVIRDMRAVCSGCKSKSRCRSDIACGWAPVVLRYCPNTSTIKALHRERYELALPSAPP